LRGGWNKSGKSIALELIYKAGMENPDVVKVLLELEKKHSDVSVKYGASAARLLANKLK
jgi:hypothetical protein